MTDAGRLHDSLKKYSPEQKIVILNKILRDQFSASLFKTCRFLLGMKDVNIGTHGDMILALEADTDKKLIVMPRGSLKSSVGVTGFSIWRLLRDPNERILIDSEVYENSKNFLREIKAYIESPLFFRLYGNWKTRNWNEGEITISARWKPFKEASITCGGIATVKVGQHYSVILEDDLNSRNNSETVEGRKKVLDHHRLNDAILDPGGTLVVVGTRYASDDVIGYILDEVVEPHEKAHLMGLY